MISLISVSWRSLNVLCCVAICLVFTIARYMLPNTKLHSLSLFVRLAINNNTFHLNTPCCFTLAYSSLVLLSSTKNNILINDNTLTIIMTIEYSLIVRKRGFQSTDTKWQIHRRGQIHPQRDILRDKYNINFLQSTQFFVIVYFLCSIKTYL